MGAGLLVDEQRVRPRALLVNLLVRVADLSDAVTQGFIPVLLLGFYLLAVFGLVAVLWRTR